MQHNLDLGQHFLKDDSVVNKMIEASEIKKEDNVLEIGAGLGVLSKQIASKCKQLQIVEIDERLKPYLNAIAKDFGNVKIEYTNALKYNFTPFDKIVTSLPYNILEPFLFKCVKQKVPFIVMLIGDKYALSLKDTNVEKGLTITQLLTKTFFDATLVDFVSKNCFDPEPRTASYIVKLTKKQTLNKLDYVMAEIFMQTDKKIKSALKEAIIRYNTTQNQVKTQKMAKQIIADMNIDENILESFFSSITNEQLTTLYKCISEDINII